MRCSLRLALRWLALVPATFCTGLAFSQTVAAQAYVDRVLDQSEPARLGDSDEPAPDIDGWPRGYHFDTQLRTTRTGGTSSTAQYLNFDGFLQTPNYGSWSASGTLFKSNDIASLGGSPGNVSGATLRIDQRGMPVGDGWLLNNSAGDTNSLVLPISRGLGHLQMPAAPIEGLSTELTRSDSTVIQASLGWLGYFNGQDIQGFSLERGSMASLGMQTRLMGASAQSASRLDAGAQFQHADNVPQNGVAGTEQSTDSLWAGLNWQGQAPWAQGPGRSGPGLMDRLGGMQLQTNFLLSSGRPSTALSTAPADRALGLWTDASWRTEWLRNAVSLFYFQPSLRWGAANVASDIEGLSFRSDMGSRQWQLGWSTELSRPVSNPAQFSTFTGVNARYSMDTRNSISGLLGLRTGTGIGESLQLAWENRSDTEQTQWRVNASRAPDSQSLRLGADHSWTVREGSSFSTSLGWERDTSSGLASNAMDWGLLGNARLFGNISLNASVRGTRGLNGNVAQFLNANVQLSAPLSARWSASAQYSASLGQQPVDTSVVSALTAASTAAAAVSQPAMRSFMLTLRYQDQAGLGSAPIGGQFGSAAGSIEGTVFLDANGNGRREAVEAGLPSVTVILNGRFVSRTDAQGRYAFPAVAVGSYTLEILPDNIPLPWAPMDRDPVKVRVDVRSSTVRDFAIQRPETAGIPDLR